MFSAAARSYIRLPVGYTISKGFCPDTSVQLRVMANRVKVDFRLPHGLLERVGAEAARLGQTRTLFVERALESALGDNSIGREPTVAPSGVAAGRAGSSPAPPVSSRASGKPFRCPIYTCTFESGSPAAVCGRHGRKVIPA